jgi:hypothetical protein
MLLSRLRNDRVTISHPRQHAQTLFPRDLLGDFPKFHPVDGFIVKRGRHLLDACTHFIIMYVRRSAICSLQQPEAQGNVFRKLTDRYDARP